MGGVSDNLRLWRRDLWRPLVPLLPVASVRYPADQSMQKIALSYVETFGRQRRFNAWVGDLEIPTTPYR
jgi:hypothetical protein